MHRSKALLLIIFSLLLFFQAAFAEQDPSCKSALVTPHRPGILRVGALSVLRNLLNLRYDLEIEGLDEVAHSTNGKGHLFLPNHTGLNDPMIILSNLDPRFHPRAVMAEHVLNYPIMKWMARQVDAVIIPNAAAGTREAVDRSRAAIQQIIDGINRGENFLLYPSGHITKTFREDLGSRSGIKQILEAVPEANIALVRTQGLWGSSFSFGATGAYPNAAKAALRAIPFLAANGIFFGPKRRVKIQVKEAKDFPRDAEALEMNRYLEEFYNERFHPNTYVPFYRLTQGSKAQQRPEPEIKEYSSSNTADDVPSETKEAVIKQLQKILNSEIEISEKMTLAGDLGLDSLNKVDLVLWLEQFSSIPQSNSDALLTVADAMLAANGKVLSAEIKLKPVSKKWKDAKPRPLALMNSQSVAEAFLRQAQRQPGLAIAADETGGTKTYRELITALLLIIPMVEKMPGEKIGLMLPASVGADIFFLAVQLAGKIPVQLNFTVGPRNFKHMMESLEIKQVITSKQLIDKLTPQGITEELLGRSPFYAESLAKKFTTRDKALALARTYNPLTWRGLLRRRLNKTSVVLFTSGSENLPKAVPLSHKNHLSNVRGMLAFNALNEKTRLLSFLPPFHSFGNTVMQVAPLVLGIPVVYSPNPKDTRMLARVAQAYQVSVTAGTPGFIEDLLKTAQPEQLEKLEFAMTGGDSLPDSLLKLSKEKFPWIEIGEGYGITETGPIISGNSPGKIEHGTIGYPLPWVHFLIVHPETGEILSKGQGQIDEKGGILPPIASTTEVEGLLLVRGDSVMDDYLNFSGDSPFKNIEGERYYSTGDLIRIQSNGRLKFISRLKDLIKIEGEMVSLPAIVEALKSEYKDEKEGPALTIVADSSVSKTRPAIILATRMDLNLDEVNAYLRRQGFSGLSRVTRIFPMKEIPTLGSGKVNKRAILEAIQAIPGAPK